MSRASRKRAKKRHNQTQKVENSDTKRSRNDEPMTHSNSSSSYASIKPGARTSVSEGVNVPKEAPTNVLEIEDPVDISDILSKCNTILDVLSFDDEKSGNFSLTPQRRASAVLQFVLGSVSVKEFYSEYWEKKPLLVQKSAKKGHNQRFDGLLSKKRILDILEKQPVFHGRDLNVTRYVEAADGVKRRESLDLVKQVEESDEIDELDDRNFVQVDPPKVWRDYTEGCTIRLLCPHKYVDEVHNMLGLLEMEWGCMVGANAYLTPPKVAQGFAPHYDDIDAYCLQLEGSKRWKVYPPRSDAEKLPRYSSRDFTEDDLNDTRPCMDVVLEEGDLLYMPRGWIHQACTQDDHSLHLTISAMQTWSWADLMETVLPIALNNLITSGSAENLRNGLPRRFLDYMGTAHENSDEDLPDSLKALKDIEEEESEAVLRQKTMQAAFREESKKCVARIADEAMKALSSACDELGKRFIVDRQPPRIVPLSGATACKAVDSLLPNDRCRLAQRGIARLVLEDGKAIVYHCLQNSRVYHGGHVSPLEFEMDDGPALEQLLTTVEPEWIRVCDLIHDSIEDKVGVAQALLDEGLLHVQRV